MTVDDVIAALCAAVRDRAEVNMAALFGSAVTRGPDQARDIDVAFAFARPLSLFDLGALAVKIESRVGKEIDVVDLDSASTLLRWEVARTGRLAWSRRPEDWPSFQSRVTFEYADLEPFFRYQSEGLRRALAGARWSKSTS